MAPLEFEFQEFIDEINAFTKVASRYLTLESIQALHQLETSLAAIRQLRRGTLVEWGIAETFPLRTIVSDGKYERNGRGHHHLFAEITSIWEIAPSDPRASRYHPNRTFALVGKASTRVRLVDASSNSNTTLALWRMEIGDDASPGCHFHVQVLGEDQNPPFPQTLSIPRFPGILVTPVVVVEFVLAELFQDAWREHSARETAEMNRWRPIQARRLSRILEWERNEATLLGGSPWTALKWAKPPSGLFI